MMRSVAIASIVLLAAAFDAHAAAAPKPAPEPGFGVAVAAEISTWRDRAATVGIQPE
jgi:hypothetical protein